MVTERVGQLSPEDMWILRDWLDKKPAEYEDELMLCNPGTMAEFREAQAEYKAGKHVSLEQVEGEMDVREDRMCEIDIPDSVPSRFMICG